MYRKSLKLSLLAVIIVGIFFIFIPFTSSLKPNDATFNSAPHMDITFVKKGQSIELEVPQYKIHISRESNNRIVVFATPYRDGLYQLPEFNWQRSLLPCRSFIQEFGYQCLDTIDNEAVWYSYMKWDKGGKYIGEHKWGEKIPNLLIPKYKISAEQFTFLGL